MRNLGSILAVTLLLLTGFEESLNAQPYFYGYRPREDSRYALVYRINLATGQEEPFLPDSMRISSVWSDPGQKWVYVDERGRLLVVDADNPSVVHMPLGSGPTGGIDGILYVPQLNRFYISWVEGTGGEVKQTLEVSMDLRLLWSTARLTTLDLTQSSRKMRRPSISPGRIPLGIR